MANRGRRRTSCFEAVLPAPVVALRGPRRSELLATTFVSADAREVSRARDQLTSSAASAKREGKRLDTRTEELDRERSIDDRVRLSNQLIQPLFDNRPVASFVDIHTARPAW